MTSRGRSQPSAASAGSQTRGGGSPARRACGSQLCPRRALSHPPEKKTKKEGENPEKEEKKDARSQPMMSVVEF
jgi:hypothetical protein